MNFEQHMQESAHPSRWTRPSRGSIARSIAVAKYLANSTAESLAEMQPENAIMNGPKGSVFAALVEHTAHHRGALTVYSRLSGSGAAACRTWKKGKSWAELRFLARCAQLCSMI